MKEPPSVASWFKPHEGENAKRAHALLNSLGFFRCFAMFPWRVTKWSDGICNAASRQKSGSSSLPSSDCFWKGEPDPEAAGIPPKLQHTGKLVTKQISGRSGLPWRPRLSKRPRLFRIRWVYHGLSRFTMVYHLSHWTTEHLTFSK